MKKNTLLNILLCTSILAISACNDETKPNPQAKSIKGSTAVMLDSPTYTQGDLDLLSNIRAGNDRRVKSILDNGSANLYSSDENNVSGLMAAAGLKSSTITEILLEKTTPGDDKVLNRGDSAGKTPMFYAAETGVPESITLLRKKGANPNIYDNQQNFPLLIAAKANNLEAVKAILANIKDVTPANPDLQDNTGDSAALVATRNYNKDILKTLKDFGANLNISNGDGITPLIYTIGQKNKEFFDYLLSLGADINAISSGEKTPLIYAIENKNYDFAKYILDKGANANTHASGLSSPLQILVSNDNADATLTDYLLTKGANLTDADTPGGNVLGRAIHKGNAAAISKLIAKGAKVSDLETITNNGLLQALNIDEPEIALVMINNGADISKADESGFSPLALAAKKKYKNVFDALVKKGADVNQTSRNKSAIPVEIVIDSDDADMLETMFANGLKANPDAILLRAVSAKEDNIIPVTIKHGARPNIMNNTGQPVVWLAIAKDDNAATKVLVENGALLDVQDSAKGISPLSLAIARGNTEIAQYLLSKNANPDLVDNNGFSSLAYAAASGQVDIVKLLLEHKVEVNSVDKSGNTILNLLDLSKTPKDKKDAIKKLLTDAGAK